MLMKDNGLFVPCEAAGGDEMFPVGIFVFNITKMIEHLTAVDHPTVTITLSEFYRAKSTINEDHLDTVELSKPVIVAEISPDRYNLIDGHHRMEQANRTGLTTLPAYRLQAHEHYRFLTTQKAYEAYLNYWNEKVEDYLHG